MTKVHRVYYNVHTEDKKGEITEVNRYDEDIGKIHTTAWYADGGLSVGEVMFSVPASKWDEFLKSKLFKKLKKYVDSFDSKEVGDQEWEKENAEERHRIVTDEEKAKRGAVDWGKNQPGCIWIDDIEIPSSQRFWEVTRRIERRIHRLSRCIVFIALSEITIAIIILMIIKQ